MGAEDVKELIHQPETANVIQIVWRAGWMGSWGISVDYCSKISGMR